MMRAFRTILIIAMCLVGIYAPAALAQEDVIRGDLSADEARRALRDGQIAPLTEIRRRIRSDYDVMEFLNERLVADRNGQPAAYCVRILVAPDTRLDLQVDPRSGNVQVDPYTGRLYPEWRGAGVSPNRCAVAQEARSNAPAYRRR